jgi:hypothetical protein
VNVQGTLDGVLTIGTLDNMYIQNDVIYENRDLTSSNDLLGLVSENHIYVANNTPNQTNCEVDGSVFCRTGKWQAENYNSGTPRGILKVRGSIVQKERGAVGTFQGSTLKTGYSKRYYYDQRLSDPDFRPPYYPGFWVKTYAITNWWENVRIPQYSY